MTTTQIPVGATISNRWIVIDSYPEGVTVQNAQGDVEDFAGHDHPVTLA